MELSEYPKGRRLIGYQEIDLVANERVRVQTGVVGDVVDQLNEQCPNGKQWTVQITVRIDEFDA
jgi:hypothetical protein